MPIREAAGELVAHLVPGRGDSGGVGLGEDRAEYGGDHVGVRLGHVGEVDPAALMGRALERTLERGDQAGVLVGDDQPHAGQPAPFQGGQEAAPEHLVLAVAHVQAQHFPAAVGGDPGRDHDRRRHHLRGAVAYMR